MKGKKSLAIRLVFRSAEGTLTSEAVDREIERVVACFASAFQADLRGS